MGTLQWSSQGRSLRGENPSKKLRSWFNPGWRLPSDLKIFKMESGYAACRDLCWKKYERLVTCDVLMQVVQLAAHHPSLPLQFFLAAGWLKSKIQPCCSSTQWPVEVFLVGGGRGVREDCPAPLRKPCQAWVTFSVV